jgi:Ca2+-binding RTX toxin-like protein
VTHVIVGAGSIVGSSHNDLIFGSIGPDTIYGDSDGTLASSGDKAGNDIIFGIDGFDNLRGDAIIGGESASDFVRGGDDVIHIGASGTGSNDARGDADTIQVHGAGGNDLIFGSDQSDEIRGDARIMLGNAHGGDDWLWGRGGSDSLTGDAREMDGATVGGSDHLFGGSANDTLRGDARMMNDTTVGGRDWLDGGHGNDVLWGDAETLSAGAVGGNDLLAGGADHDTFDFAGHFGHDLVLDLDRGDHCAAPEQLIFTNTPGSAVTQSFDAHRDLVVSVDDGTTAHVRSTVTLFGVHDMLHDQTPLGGSDFVLA